MRTRSYGNFGDTATPLIAALPGSTPAVVGSIAALVVAAGAWFIYQMRKSS